MNETTYEIVSENKEDPTATVIRKGGITAEFSIADLMHEQMTFKKYLREGNGQLSYESGKIANIEEHHPFVLDLTEEQLFTASMYCESKRKREQVAEQIANIQGEYDESKRTNEGIFEKLGISIPSHEDVVDAAVAKITEDGGE